MRQWVRALGTACRLTLTGVGRDRLALCMVVLFIPAWIWAVRWVVREAEVRFRLYGLHGPADGVASGDFTANGNHIGQIVGALNAVTLITGFIMLMVTFATTELDRRLILCGFPRTALMLAKTTVLLLVAAVVAGYAAWLLCGSWAVRQEGLLTVAVFMAALVYGGAGIMLGSVLRRELEGVLVVIMMSLVDLGLQNPIMAREVDGIPLLPLFGPMQAAFAAAFTDEVPWRPVTHGILWLLATTSLGLGVVYARTRGYPRPT